MGSKVTERFRGQFLAVDSTTVFGKSGDGIAGISGFLATTDGTISVSFLDGSTGTLTSVNAVQTVPVTAGMFTLIPLEFPQNGGTVVLAGGASGTLFI